MKKVVNLESVLSRIEEIESLVEITQNILSGMNEGVAKFQNDPAKEAVMLAYNISIQHHLLVELQDVNTEFLQEVDKKLNIFVNHYCHSGRAKVLRIEVEDGEK